MGQAPPEENTHCPKKIRVARLQKARWGKRHTDRYEGPRVSGLLPEIVVIKVSLSDRKG